MNIRITPPKVIAIFLAILALVSVLFLGPIAAAPEFYAGTIASIDTKAETVMKLTAASTVASAVVSAIPDDTATPIAEKLADFTEYFLLILSVLYAEKYLLTLIGFGVFRILLPVACLLGIAGCLGCRGGLRQLAVKLAALCFVLFAAIPVGIGAEDMIFDTYQESIDTTIAAAQEFSIDAAEYQSSQEDGSFWSGLVGKVTQTASGLANKAAAVVNRFVESLAVLIVTACIIPVLVLLLFAWLAKLVTGAELPRERRRACKTEEKQELAAASR